MFFIEVTIFTLNFILSFSNAQNSKLLDGNCDFVINAGNGDLVRHVAQLSPNSMIILKEGQLAPIIWPYSTKCLTFLSNYDSVHGNHDILDDFSEIKLQNKKLILIKTNNTFDTNWLNEKVFNFEIHIISKYNPQISITLLNHIMSQRWCEEQFY